MIHTNPEFIYELKIGIAALQRACYEVIEACVKIDYAIRLLDKGETLNTIPVSVKQVQNMAAEIVDNPTFTPTTKPRDTKGDPLAELAAQLSPQDREKLISSLEGGKK